MECESRGSKVTKYWRNDRGMKFETATWTEGFYVINWKKTEQFDDDVTSSCVSKQPGLVLDICFLCLLIFFLFVSLVACFLSM